MENGEMILPEIPESIQDVAKKEKNDKLMNYTNAQLRVHYLNESFEEWMKTKGKLEVH
jgi:hypothetical protein